MPRFTRYLLIILCAYQLSAFADVPANQADIYLQIKENIGIFGTVYRELNNRYVDTIDPEAFMQAGIEGMLSTLDPYTVFLDNDESDDLHIMTAGKYGGVGIEIGVRGKDKVLTVISPIEGGPAERLGIRPGDKIVEIDSISTAGFSTSDAAQHLRGDPGTSVTITVERIGVAEPINFTLLRDNITVKDISFSGLLDNTIGYVRLTRFSRNAGSELRRELNQLKQQGMTGIILDLRHNPGGLLPAAVEVTQNFVSKGETIVSTKGRSDSSEKRFKSLAGPIVPDLPMVVLVDEGSASAAEIVAGALQDLDRAVIVGKSTFGKGLVQTLVDFKDGRALKITTARYYTPSGRLIQKLDYFEENDAILKPAGYSEEPDRVDVYDTRSGRTVYGGGGITPDIEVALPELNRYETELLGGGYFYDFTARYLSDHPNTKNYEITAAIIDQFRAYLDEKGFVFKTDLEQKLDELQVTVTEQEIDGSDVTDCLNALQQAFAAQKPDYFTDNLDFVELTLKRNIAGLLDGRKGSILAGLEEDTQMQAALDLLGDLHAYRQILTGPQQAMGNKE
ncbi:S41 family peptidase [bacterium]|nr:S41 family peptidase [bacterium]